MSDGNKFDVITYTQQRQQSRLPLEEMGNVLLDAMQGTLICLDNHHVIIDASKTIKDYFGFEQADILGLSILLLIEDSERDFFSKFLCSTSQLFDICCVRIMVAMTNEYRQVKVHRKRKFNQETADVHSTTTKSVGTILVLTIDDSSYIDITLFDANKQEFYTKMNLLGEITFEDHRGALITGYLPHEIITQSIFSLVYHEDRLVKLHALWKCATTGGSKLQWRLTARDGSLVFLQTEYKLVANHQNHETIVARNEVLSPVQRAQFEELQTAWRHQCTADIRGNGSSFKRMTSAEIDLSSLSPGECCICVPALNMCFSTNKLHSLNISGNIFDGTKLTRSLTLQDYVSILFEHDKYLDSELINIINNLTALSSRYKQMSNQSTNETDSLDIAMNEKSQSDYSELNSRKKSDSDSIVRGILSNSAKYNHEKQTGDSPSALTRLLNGNSGQNDLLIPPQQQQSQPKTSQTPLHPKAIQQQHVDFIKKYRSAKAKLEAQLELTRTQEIPNGNQSASDIMKRNTILSKLSQLEHIKNKHLAHTHELQRQAQRTVSSPPINNLEQTNSLSPKSVGSMSMDPNNPMALQSSSYNPSTYYQHQRNSPPVYRPFDINQGPPPSYHDSYKTPVFDEFLTPPSSTYHPVNNNPSLSVHSYMNVSFQDTTTNPPSTMTSSSFNHYSTPYPY